LQWVDGASIDPVTGVFTWTPPNSIAPGSYYFSIRAEDDQYPPGIATTSFFVDVFTAVITNAPPVFAPVSNATVRAGTTLTMRLTATDTAGQRITYSLSSSTRPPGSTIGASDGVFSWTPSIFQSAGRFYATVFATDDQNPPATAQVTFYIDVLPANTPPVFQIVSNSVVSAGSTLTVNIIARDTPGQQVTYALLARPSGATINSTNGLFTWNVPASQDLGRYYVTVQAADDQTPAATASFTFAIDVVGQPKLRIARVSNPGFLIFWPTVPGTTYELQYKTNFTETNWTSIIGPFVAQQTIYSYSGPFNGTSRFYRLKTTY
jgi:hypothetical protein